MSQKLVSHPKSSDGEIDAEPEKRDTINGVDGILDDIDDVLEENATEFVRSYIQEGGQ